MSAYAVYELKEARRMPSEARAEALVLVRDGFNWVAFLLSGLWLAMGRHWRALLVWAAVIAGGGLVMYAVGLGVDAFVGLWLAAAVVVGYEAADLEGERLLAGEGHEIGYVTGDSRGDCEVGAVRRLATMIAAEQQANESADA
ncbi:MAG: DUF2628 domain-containing protein [Hyphomicrobiaceae bacterium]